MELELSIFVINGTKNKMTYLLKVAKIAAEINRENDNRSTLSKVFPSSALIGGTLGAIHGIGSGANAGYGEIYDMMKNAPMQPSMMKNKQRCAWEPYKIPITWTNMVETLPDATLEENGMVGFKRCEKSLKRNMIKGAIRNGLVGFGLGHALNYIQNN